MWRPDRKPLIGARRPWYEALHLPGASQMQYACRLLLSRPFLERIPDQSLIVSEVGAKTNHVQATRDRGGSYALIYIPSGNPVELDLSRLVGERLVGYWYDPRTGTVQSIGIFQKQNRMRFTPPAGGPDWVLVLDDLASDFPMPGRMRAYR